MLISMQWSSMKHNTSGWFNGTLTTIRLCGQAHVHETRALSRLGSGLHAPLEALSRLCGHFGDDGARSPRRP